MPSSTFDNRNVSRVPTNDDRSRLPSHNSSTSFEDKLGDNNLDWLPDVSELMSDLRRGGMDLLPPRAPTPRSSVGVSLPAMRHTPSIPSDADRETRIAGEGREHLQTNKKQPVQKPASAPPIDPWVVTEPKLSARGNSGGGRKGSNRSICNSSSNMDGSSSKPVLMSSSKPVTPSPGCGARILTGNRELQPRDIPLPPKVRPRGEWKDPKKMHPASNNRHSDGRDTDIVSAMAHRLSRVERSLTQKNLEVEALRCELDVCRRALARCDGSVETLSLQQENEDLRMQIAEITEFLADYGLTWVGDKGKVKETNTSDGESSSSNTAAEGEGDIEGKARDSSEQGSKVVDIHYIESKVDQLNAIAEKESKIVRQNGVTRFDMDRRVTIVFYKDGLRVGDLPFFSYESEQGSRIIHDIVDGYFPYCLKKQYPGGIPLIVKDNTGELFSDHKQAQQAFINRLPQKIIMENGNICEIRRQIEDRLGKNDVAVLGSGGEEHCSTKKNARDLRPENWDKEEAAVLCKIQIRDGPNSWVFHLSSLQKIETIIASLSVPEPFQLRSGFPERKMHEPGETLFEAGLVPNACLFVHRDMRE